MANLSIKNIVGTGIYSLPSDDAALQAACSGIKSLLALTEGLIAEGLYGEVVDSKLNIYVQCAFDNGGVYVSKEDLETDLISAKLLSDNNISSIEISLTTACANMDDIDFDQSECLLAFFLLNLTTGQPGVFEATVDAYQSSVAAGNNIKAMSSPPEKKSWLMLQPPGNDNEYLLYKPFFDLSKYRGDYVLGSKLSINSSLAATGRESCAGVVLCNSLTGIPDQNNGIKFFFSSDSDNGNKAIFEAKVAGEVAASYSIALSQAGGRIGIHKIGNVFHGWVEAGHENWLYIGNVDSSALAPDYNGLIVKNKGAGAPGNEIIWVDYIKIAYARFAF